MEPRHSYYAYGMIIHSNHLFPELVPCEAPVADLTYRRTALPFPMPEGGQVFEFDENNAYLSIGGIGHCLIRSKALVEFEPNEGIDPAALNLVLLGSVMATILHLRGYLTLHASAVEIAGCGAVFMGDKGAGKSTTAAAFISAGHRLLTDDVLAIDVAGEGPPRIIPGFPQLKLSQNASDAIALPQATTLPIGNFGFNKSRLHLGEDFGTETVPPAVFYALSHRDMLETKPLSGVESLAALMANSYHARFGDKVFRGRVAATQMQRCAKMLATAKVKRLEIPPGLDRLPEAVKFVERDIRT
jgi:hypothetical protein